MMLWMQLALACDSTSMIELAATIDAENAAAELAKTCRRPRALQSALKDLGFIE